VSLGRTHRSSFSSFRPPPLDTDSVAAEAKRFYDQLLAHIGLDDASARHAQRIILESVARTRGLRKPGPPEDLWEKMTAIQRERNHALATLLAEGERATFLENAESIDKGFPGIRR
jgi:hypothetical protein